MTGTQLKINGSASVIKCLKLLAEEMEKKREFTTVMARLPEENHALAQRLQERTGRAESLMAELAEARDAVAARENDVKLLRSHLNNAFTAESQSADLTDMHPLLPRPGNVSDTDAIKLVGRLNTETFQSAVLRAEAGRPLKDIDSYGYHPHQRDIRWPQIRGLDRRSLALPSGPDFSVVWRGLYDRLVGWYATVECDGQRSATR